MKNKLDDLNVKRLNEIFKVTGKVLNLLYFLLIATTIFIVILILKEWKVMSFILTILKVISPLFIGFIIAWLLNPLVCKLTDRGMKRGSSIILIFSMAVIFLYFFTLALIPTVGKQIQDVGTTVSSVKTNAESFVDKTFDKMSSPKVNLDGVKENVYDRINDTSKSVTKNLPDIFYNFVKSMASGIGVILVSLVIGFFMLFKFDKVNDSLLLFVPKKHKKDVKKLIEQISSSLFDFVQGTLLISFVIFIIMAIGFSLIGLKSPILFALFCGLTNLIPYIGPYIGGIPAVLVGLTQGTPTGIIILIFIIIIQAVEGNIITPLIMSKKMELSPITIIVALLIFGYFFGILGMLIATPVAAVIKILYCFFDEKCNFFGYTDDEKKIRKLVKNKK